MDVIGKLNRLRLERNLSVYRLAELTGLNQSTLANTFSRGTVPSLRNLEIICGALGMTLAQFFSEGETCVPLTESEAEFYRNYKKLPPQVRQSVDEIVKTLADNINRS